MSAARFKDWLCDGMMMHAHSVLTGPGLILNHSVGGIVSKISDNGTAWLLAQLLSLISGASDQTRDLAALGMMSDEQLEHEHI